MKLTIEKLKEKNLILLECISGSRAYNLATENSDTDIRGIFYLPKEEFFGLDDQTKVSNESNDIFYYEIGRFMELLIKNNPSCLEVLATPDQFILYKSPLLNDLNYKDFITADIKKTFNGYAFSQLKKAKGLNKKFLNPVEKKRKTILDFCYCIEDERTVKFAAWLESNGYKQEFCGLAKINHVKDLYALYYDENSDYKGIVKDDSNNEIRVSEIPKGKKMCCYFIFLKDEYSIRCKQYKEYWDWVKLRNEDRYTTNIKHEKDYDSKNMMHTIRLLKVAKELLLTGNLNVERTNDREELLAIKNGQYTYDEVINIAENLQKEIENIPFNEDLYNVNHHKNIEFLVNLRTKLYG